MSLAIVGIGTAQPATRITQDEAVQVGQMLCCRDAADAGFLPHLYEQTTIVNRHLAFDRGVFDDILDGTRHTGSPFLPSPDPDAQGPTTAERMQHYMREAGPLALRAAARALDDSGVAPEDITHLVTVSCTGFSAPGVDFELIGNLGLRATIERTNVGFMGCHGALNGLRVTRALAASQPDACILLCAVELCGVHYHYAWNPKRVIANALFADGAGALVGVPDHAAPMDAWQALASGACIFPESANAMTWKIGDHGFEMSLAARVPEMIADNLRPWMETWLAGQGLGLADVGSWAVHPGGPRIVDAVEEALDLTPRDTEDSRAVLAECGNMSSPTILFVLERLRQKSAPRPCVAIGFGPGLAAEAALIG
jgi:predicted naringenin-chalcone synthase